MRRKTFTLLLCVILLPILDACSRKKTDIDLSNKEEIFFRDGGTYKEEYVLYNSKNGSRYYFDVATGKSGPYCFEPGCNHEKTIYSETGEIIRQGCASYDYVEFPIAVEGQYLYYLASNCLFRADREGNHRELLAELSKPYELNETQVLYTEENVFLAYSLSYDYFFVEDNGGKGKWQAGKRKEKPEVGVLKIPTSGGKEEAVLTIDGQYEAQVVQLWLHDNSIVFMIQTMDRPSKYVDMSTDGWQDLVEEEKSHTYLEVYDYSISSGEAKRIVEPRPDCEIYFFSDVYGIIEKESESMDLFRYDGEMVSTTEGGLRFGIQSDKGVLAWDGDTYEVVSLDEESGSIQRRSPLTWRDFLLNVVVGKSYYGVVLGSQGEYLRAYISEENFWSGDKEKIVVFPDQ